MVYVVLFDDGLSSVVCRVFTLACFPCSVFIPVTIKGFFNFAYRFWDRLCGLVVRVLGYRSGGPGSIPGITRKKSSGSGTGSTQRREYS
jgi:hypothetical protein